MRLKSLIAFCCFLWLHTVVSDTIAMKYHGPRSGELNSRLKKLQEKAAKVYCWSSEPCLYGFSSGRDAALQDYRVIPTWCKCRPSQVCDFFVRDHQLRADIYRCSNAPQEIDDFASFEETAPLQAEQNNNNNNNNNVAAVWNDFAKLRRRRRAWQASAMLRALSTNKQKKHQ